MFCIEDTNELWFYCLYKLKTVCRTKMKFHRFYHPVAEIPNQGIFIISAENFRMVDIEINA